MKEINGDYSREYPLSLASKIWYLCYNAGRGMIGYVTRLKTTYWTATEFKISPDSPGRRYLDLFLEHKLPEIVPVKDITVLDVGCGGGYLREKLRQAGYFGVYTGIDVTRNPRYSNDDHTAFTSTFVETKIEDYAPHTVYDLVISNTALEHVADDATAVRRSRELTQEQGTQVHIVPSFWSLFAYLWHGYRQYTPRRIKKLFEGQPYQVYRLGGLASLVLHVAVITIPERIIGFKTVRNTTWYSKAVSCAQRLDTWLPFCSLMYVIVVQKK